MSKRVTKVIGKPVVSAITGERLGTVADLLLDDTGMTLVGFVLQHGWMKHECVLPISLLQTIGPDAIVSRSSAVVSAKEWHDQRASSDGQSVDASRDTGRS